MKPRAGRARARPRAAAARLHLQLPRSPDARHPRPADQGRPPSQRHRVRGDRRPRLRFALFGARRAARLSRRPDQPERSHRRFARRVERLHRLVRDGDGLLANCSSTGSASASARRAESRRPMRSSPTISRRERRARALAIFSLGIPIGLALGTLIGAYIAAAIDWRAAFIVDGHRRGPARADPAGRRRATGADAQPRCAAPFGQRLPITRAQAGLLAARLRRVVQLAVRLRPRLVDAVGADAQLRPRPRSTGELPGVADLSSAAAPACSPAAGSPTASGDCDRGWYARLPAIAWLITAPAFAVGLLAPSLWLAWPLLLDCQCAQYPVARAGDRPRSSTSCRGAMRATASASFLLINNLIGLGVGPLLIGRPLGRAQATYGVDALRNAAVGLYRLLSAGGAPVLALRQPSQDARGSTIRAC